MKKILFAILLMAPLSIFAQKFAHFNSSDIIPNMKEYTKAMDELKVLGEQLSSDLKMIEDEFKTKLDAFQKEADKLLENVRARREKDLQDLQTRYQQSMQDNQQAFQKAEAEKMQAIQDLVMAALKKVGEAGGYVYVVDTSAGVIPFVNPSLSTDITPEIKKALGM
ncbi:MAG: OmpH family outer membrane protein [Bacteroidaceae bacterium]|nr:OmpH family outer membrane protein [Bacteroidaceae bacterium]